MVLEVKRFEIEIYDKEEIGQNKWPQAKFFYSGSDDVIWTDDPLILLYHIAKDLSEV